MKLYRHALALLLLSAPSYGADTNDFKSMVDNTDWSKKVKQMNFRSHLTTPTAGELKSGAHNSRRLARNHIRLGIDEEHHRKLAPENPPARVVKLFEEQGLQGFPSTGPKLEIDNFTQSLPFGDGPGVKPGLPQGTRDFWLGDKPPTKVWEVVACPVYDIERFLSDPLSCVFGDGEGTIMDFIRNIDPDKIVSVLKETVVPIAVEFVWAISPMIILEKALAFLCDVLGIVDSIKDFVGGAVGDVVDFFNPFSLFDVNSLNQLEDGDSFAPCDGDDFSICREEANIDCDECLEDPKKTAEECGECRHCWKPLGKAVPQMDGICLSSVQLRELTTNPMPIATSQGIYSILLSNYVTKTSDPEAIVDAVSGLISSKKNMTVEDLVDTLAVNIDEKTDDIIDHIDETCDNPDLAHRQLFDQKASKDGSNKDRISEFVVEPGPVKKNIKKSHLFEQSDNNEEDDEKISNFLGSDAVKDIKRRAAKDLGMASENVDKAFHLFKDAFGSDVSHKDKIKEKMMNDPAIAHELEEMFKDEVRKNPEKYQKQVTGRLLKTAINPNTGFLEKERMKKIHSALVSAREGNLLAKKKSGLGDECDEILAAVKKEIQDFMADVLISLIDKIADSGDSGAFNTDQQGTNYDLDFAEGLMKIPVGFVKMLDPFQSNSFMHAILRLVIKAYQTIAGYLMFGCDVTGENCGDLPSMVNNVLPIEEARNGEIFMNSGCDSNFEGELLFYTAIHKLAIDLFDAAGDAVIEFFNIPIIVVRYLLEVSSSLFEHMAGVCAYLDSYVQLAKVEATYENTRYALRELACREAEGGLKRGYGCDGKDNTCDEDSQIDECDEDVFPPDLDVTSVVAYCEGQIFSTTREGLECIKKYAVATDDCQPVQVDVSLHRATSTKCDKTATVTATATNCVALPGDITTARLEDITTASIPFKVDGDAPSIACTVFVQDLEGISGGYEDISFSYDISDECDSEVDVEVKVFSNELSNHVNEMVFISEPGLTIFVQDQACGMYDDCKISNYEEIESKSKSKSKGYTEEFPISREYQVQISATDSAGNTGMAICSTFVGTDTSDGNHLFEVASYEFTTEVSTSFAPTGSPTEAPSSSPSEGKSKGKSNKGRVSLLSRGSLSEALSLSPYSGKSKGKRARARVRRVAKKLRNASN